MKGFTHDLLLEAGVFLVSAKLILMAKKNAETEFRLEQHLNDIKGVAARDYETLIQLALLRLRKSVSFDAV